ncbi:MAG: phosphoribosylanthranilate isomerase [Huintestinicola sp.]
MIKICGMRRMEDILLMNECLPDFVGFVFYSKSKRYVTFEEAAAMGNKLDTRIKKVGLFVNSSTEDILDAVKTAKLDIVQLHGDEDSDFAEKLRSLLPDDVKIWKAVRVRSPEDVEAADRTCCDALLLDSFSAGQYGGTGNRADLSLIEQACFLKPFLLAGGINKDNLAETADFLQRFPNSMGIDLSSALETDGFKDRDKVIDIMSIYRLLRKECLYEQQG